MNSFFGRIFLAVWSVILLGLAMTWLYILVVKESIQNEQPFFSELTTLSATKLRLHLAEHSEININALTNDMQLNYENTFFMFIFDPQGNEVLGRDYPMNNIYDYMPFAKTRSIEVTDGLKGYKLIGYQRYIPIRAVIAAPGFRASMIIFTIGLSVVVSLILSRFIVGPIRKLREAGQQVAKGDLSVRIAHSVEGRNDDIALFAKEFDHMTSRIETLLEDQKRLMRDVSHELRSPLARLQALSSLSRQKLQNGESFNTLNDLDKMEIEIERINYLIERILTYARLDSGTTITRQRIDLVDLLKTIADDACIEGLDKGKDVIVNGPQRCLLYIESMLMQSAFENIVRNALHYTKPDTVVEINVVDKDDYAVVTITDEGPGVENNHIEKIFEPFFRANLSREHGTGGGIGLAIAERAVKLHNGKITASNRTNGGLAISITLPRCSK